jgi:Ca2+-binding EF-hand superfamily protein
MTRHIPTSALVLTALLMAATVASAAPGDRAGMRGGPDFATLDANSDGVITPSDLEDAAQARFDALDADKDGQISQAELAAGADAREQQRRADRMGAMLERLDADGNGTLSPEEMSRGDRASRMFERVDSNEDGQISEAEFEAMDRGGRFHGGPRHHMR